MSGGSVGDIIDGVSVAVDLATVGFAAFKVASLLDQGGLHTKLGWKDIVVSTAAGDGKDECRDGFGPPAALSKPWGLVQSPDARSLIFTEVGSHRIRRYDLIDGMCPFFPSLLRRIFELRFRLFCACVGRVSTLLGSGKGFVSGDAKTTQFTFPLSLCFDPLKPNNLFIGEYYSIRYWDMAKNEVTLIAGDGTEGFADGVGSKARFYGVSGMLCHPDGKTLYLCDKFNRRLRKVDLPSQTVTTIAGDGLQGIRDGKGLDCSVTSPVQLVFDQSPNVKPNSVFLFACSIGLRRYDIETGAVTTIKFALADKIHFDFSSLAWAPSGHLVVGGRESFATGVYLIDVQTASIVRVAGKESMGQWYAEGGPTEAQFTELTGIAINEREHCLFTTDYDNNRIRRITLPPEIFAAPTGSSGGGVSSQPDQKSDSEFPTGWEAERYKYDAKIKEICAAASVAAVVAEKKLAANEAKISELTARSKQAEVELKQSCEHEIELSKSFTADRVRFQMAAKADAKRAAAQELELKTVWI